MKKSFNDNDVVRNFITQPTETPRPEEQPFEVPKGYRLERELKSDRLNLLIRPSTKEELKRIAARKGISLNDLINTIFEEYIERSGNE